MSKLRVLIVDDEPLIRKGVRNAAELMEGVEIVCECAGGAEAVAAIAARNPDLVLLDVQLPDCSGLEVISQVGAQRMPPVIFITAYDDYAVQAFDANAVDYLLKPFDQERFCESIDRARQRIAGKKLGAVAGQLQNLLAAQPLKWPERLVVRRGEKYEFVAVETIDWIESANNYVELHCGSRQHLLGETLSRLEARLDPARFRRIHRCRLVNLSRVAAVHPLLSGCYELELQNGVRLTSGRLYKDVIQKLMRT
jgi:two-component system, LytTR family, response regulator